MKYKLKLGKKSPTHWVFWGFIGFLGFIGFFGQAGKK